MERENKITELARDILVLSRNTLLVNLRFLDLALSELSLTALPIDTIVTDGSAIGYNPLYVLKCYRKERERTVRDYLHMVLHCVFRHMFVDPHLNRDLWDLSCDIAVEQVICELGLKSTAAAREREQKAYLQNLRTKIGLMTAEKIYHYFVTQNLPVGDLATVRSLFFADDHFVWYLPPEEADDLMGRNNSHSSGGRSNVGRKERWKDISERMQEELETFSKRQGTQAGNLMQNLRAVNREKYDYTSFLRKFAVMGELMKINDDEFDQIFYTYGLQMYDKMPLIEPLEYKEVKRIREFVIAIDTSGSVAGDKVQAFMQKTYNILKSTESFFSRVNIHLIQCDADIQSHKVITCQEDFDEYIKKIKIYGLGGTDFRPVFQFVDELREKKVFRNLKGLIYFTDGCGTFPARKPDYDTAFVFVDDVYNNPDVPPWAIKLVLQMEEI